VNEEASSPRERAPVTITVNGQPTPEQLAAVVAVLASRAVAVEEQQASAPSRWNHRAALLRQPLPHGPGAWRASVRL
jgi:Acyl-CoA carboxylase epsilon subunit